MAGRAKKTGLGRGLDALLKDREEALQKTVRTNPKGELISSDDSSISEVSIDLIKPNENQPRKYFDEEKLEELAASIREHGIIQPLVVRRKGDVYEIVAGERRFRAARKAGLKKLPVIIKDFTDEENMLIAIIENMQREDLNPIEEADGINQMISTYGLTQEQVSKTLGKSRPYITNSLRLLKLPPQIKELVISATISQGHGRALLGTDDKKLQAELCKRIVDEGLSVRQVEKIIADSKAQKSKRAKRQKKAKDPNILAVEENLKQIFGTKVLIEKKGKKGNIVLEYYNEEELDRIIDLLGTLG